MAQTTELKGGEDLKLPRTIIKVMGNSENFMIEKLEHAIKQASGTDENIIQVLMKKVLDKINGNTTTSTTFINDIIESYLIKEKQYDILDRYISNRLEKNKEYADKVNLLGTRLVTDPDYDRGELQDFTINQIKIAANRYLQRDMKTGDIIESMTGWFDRVASHVVLGSVVYDPEVYTKDSQVGIEPKKSYDSFTVGISKTQEDVLLRIYDRLENNMIYDKQGFLVHIDNLLRTEKYQKLYRKYFQYMYQGIFEPNTPTLMNAGTKVGGLSACFTLGVEDNMKSIMNVDTSSALIFKMAGGLGVNVSHIRPSGSNIDGTYGAATGPIPLVLELINKITDVVKSGGKRRGANMGLMEYWHPDINEFIDYKIQKIPQDIQTVIEIIRNSGFDEDKQKELIQAITPEGELLNFNISVMFDSKFWEHYRSGTKYHLKFGDKVYGEQDAKEFIQRIAQSAWSSAEPGVVFKDNANKANPLLGLRGEIDICNPCLTGDTRLATDKGMIRMDELYISGKQLQIPTDNRTDYLEVNKFGISKNSAIPVFKTSDNEDIWLIETDKGYSIKATNYHEFYVRKGEGRYNKYLEKLKLRDLQIGDKLLIQSDEGYFGNQGSKDMGSVIGWYQADGYDKQTMDWKKENEKRKVVLDFYEKKKEITSQFVEYINNILPKTKSTSNIQDISSIEIKDRDQQLIGSTRLGDLFDQLNITKTQVPEIIWQGSRDCVIGYLQALFSADGTIFGDMNKSDFSIRLSSINREFLKEIQMLLGNFGIISSIRIMKKEGIRKLPKNNGTNQQGEYNCKTCYELMIQGEGRYKFVRNIGFILKYKQDKALSFLPLEQKCKSDQFITSITSITHIGKEAVYDTTVPKNHSIIVNNLVTGNCAEQFMYTGESCTLGSINLAKLVREDGTFDWDQYVNIIHETTRFLNDVLEINVYPTEHITEESNKSKRIGLGIMGLADLLFLLKIPYNSQEGFWMMEELAKTLYVESVKESIDLAEERGSCYWFNKFVEKNPHKIMEMVTRNYNSQDEIDMALGEEYMEKLCNIGVRNMWTTTVAPTGTISMIADTSSALEPIFALVFSKITNAGKYYYTSELFKQALIYEGIYSQALIEKVEKNYGSCQGIDEIPKHIQKVFVTAIDLHWMDHVVAQAVWQNWIDNSISKTINMPYNVTVNDVRNAYVLAHDLGLKGIALYRDGSRNEQVLHVGSNVQSNKNEQNVQKDSSGTVTIAVKNQVERKEIKPSNYAITYVRNHIEDHNLIRDVINSGTEFSDRQKTSCPSCSKVSVIKDSGCEKCLDCGWGACSSA